MAFDRTTERIRRERAASGIAPRAAMRLLAAVAAATVGLTGLAGVASARPAAATPAMSAASASSVAAAGTASSVAPFGVATAAGAATSAASAASAGAGTSASNASSATSASLATSAMPAARQSIAAGWSGSRSLDIGESIVLSGRVTNGDGSAAGVVRLDRRVGETWKPVLRKDVGATGRWSARITPPHTAGPVRYRVAYVRGGTAVASAELPTLSVFRVNTYSVETRGKIVADVDLFARQAAATYADPRGWARAYQRFERVRSGGDFTLVLAQARTLPTFSSNCSAQYSCRVGRFVIINQTPWRQKTPAFTGDLRTYRHMVVNHETGHWLGLSHPAKGCTGRGDRAAVMMQQSKGLQGCRFNAWPLDREVAAARR